MLQLKYPIEYCLAGAASHQCVGKPWLRPIDPIGSLPRL